MAAGAWTVYNLAKKKIGNSTLNLASTAFRVSLFTSASSGAGNSARGVISSLDDEIADGNGYSTSGKALTSEVTPRFVELFAAAGGTTPAGALRPECVVELANARGAKMRVELSGNGLCGLSTLCSAFWSAP